MTETPIERIHRLMREQFPHETGKLDQAVESFDDGMVRLLRPDGSRRYSDAEHEERRASLLGQLDATLATVNNSALGAIEKGETELVKLEGTDPLDSLKPDQQVRAAARREFVREDAERLPLDQIAERVTAVVANDDRVMQVLWHRYLGRRLEAERGQGQPAYPGSPRAALSLAYRDLETCVLGDPAKLREQRAAIEQRIESAKLLTGQTGQARSHADGSFAAGQERMRREYGLRV